MMVFTGLTPVRGNQAGIKTCLITQLGLVSICMMLRRINPMGLFLTSTSHGRPTADQTPATSAYSYIQTWQYSPARV